MICKLSVPLTVSRSSPCLFCMCCSSPWGMSYPCYFSLPNSVENGSLRASGSIDRCRVQTLDHEDAGASRGLEKAMHYCENSCATSRIRLHIHAIANG